MVTSIERIAADMHAVWTCSQAKGAARLVMLAAANAAPGPSGRRVMPLDTLAEKTSQSRSGLREALRQLAELGELQAEVVDEYVIAVLTLSKDSAP